MVSSTGNLLKAGSKWLMQPYVLASKLGKSIIVALSDKFFGKAFIMMSIPLFFITLFKRSIFDKGCEDSTPRATKDRRTSVCPSVRLTLQAPRKEIFDGSKKADAHATQQASEPSHSIRRTERL